MAFTASEARKLIVEALGGFRDGENQKSYLRRAAQTSGLGFASLRRFWKGEYGSKETVSTLESMRRERALNNEDNRAAITIEYLESVARKAELAGMPLEEIRVLRATALKIRRAHVQAKRAGASED